MKKCGDCSSVFSLSFFSKDRCAKDGLSAYCKMCRKDYKKAYYKLNKVYIALKSKKWAEANPEAFKLIKQKSAKKHRAAHYKRNKASYIANAKLRKLRKKQRVPIWLTKEDLNKIRIMYKNCPKGYHVDHIIPLAGKIVSGLHVPWNLQYLPAKDNLRKSNKHE